jgi:hypothetical protein
MIAIRSKEDTIFIFQNMEYSQLEELKENQIPLLGNHRVTFSSENERLIGFHLTDNRICYIYEDSNSCLKYLQ